ncbi:Protein CBG28023 [Caenorhabditis briggsae]|uniref:Uncharacterized protein n=2 Tax=Caenorhabditis briggsae TaxID=6238 RepID=A0AAE9FH50_CAEBR|nr:Protein CBG28023 [Caenorhabditis briggsae]ULT84249.1 hypothetical protein L3Y34_013123 [Caenorhabditis briggsae]UMM43493.1 hypothetical protein L5515_018970 [Caenorhabditis briggsae]CAR98849.1 Protein CBG28023 [Caenorhabditis briggsae]
MSYLCGLTVEECFLLHKITEKREKDFEDKSLLKIVLHNSMLKKTRKWRRIHKVVQLRNLAEATGQPFFENRYPLEYRQAFAEVDREKADGWENIDNRQDESDLSSSSDSSDSSDSSSSSSSDESDDDDYGEQPSTSDGREKIIYTRKRHAQRSAPNPSSNAKRGKMADSRTKAQKKE